MIRHPSPSPLRCTLALLIALAVTPACNDATQTNNDTSAAPPPATPKSAPDASDPVGQLAQQTRQYAQQRTTDAPNAAKANAADVEWLSPSDDARPANPRRAPQPNRTISYEPPVDPKPQPDRAATAPRPSPKPTPPDPPQPQHEPQTSEQLVGALAQRLHEGVGDDPSLRPWLARAALAVVDPRHSLTEAELASLGDADRQLVLAYQRTFTEMGQTLGKGRRDDRRKLQDLAEQLADQIDAAQSMRIRNLKLCKSVNGYGVYKTFGRNIFLAGRAQSLIVYAELDHVRTRTTDSGMKVARLTQEIVVYNQTDGLPVWRQRPVEIVDQSVNRRRDFFVVQMIKLSDRLTVGKYLLKVSITDEVGQTMDEATTPIEIVADPKLLLEAEAAEDDR